MLGYSAERLGELSFQEITNVDDLELDLDLVRDLLAGRINSYQMEKRYLRQDGGNLLGAHQRVAGARRGGVAQYFVTQVEDIDSRKRAELERERLAERIKLATDAGQIGIWEWDLARNRLHWDFRMFDLYGIRSGPGRPRWSSGRRACMPRITTACCASWSAPSAGCRNSTASSVSSAPTARFATCGRSPR